MASVMERLAKSIKASKPLIPLKIVVFCFYGGVFSLLPFLDRHVESLGLSLKNIQIPYAVLVLSSFIGAPISAYLTDKTGHFKLILSTILIASGILHTSLLFIPATTTTTRPVSARFMCAISGSYLFTDNCQKYHAECTIPENSENYKIRTTSCRQICAFNNTKTMKTSTPSRFCYQNQKKKTCPFFEENLISPTNLTLSETPIIYDMIYICVHRLKSVIFQNEHRYDMFCPGRDFGCRVECDVEVVDDKNSTLVCVDVNGDPEKMFYLYFVVRFLCMLTLSASFPLVETAILVQKKKFCTQYGHQRAWGYLAMTLVTPVVGALIDKMAVHSPGSQSFLPAFLLFSIFFIATILVVVYSLDIEIEVNSKLNLQRLKRQFYYWNSILLYIAVIFLGIFWRYLDTFVYWFLDEINSPKFILDSSVSFTNIVCIPTMYFANVFLNRLGRSNIIILSFTSYAIQIICYSLLGNHWWSVALEVLKFFTSTLQLAATVTLANILAPSGLTATMQATIYCLQFHIGSGVGILMGGSFITLFGNRPTLRIFGILSGIVGVMYAVGYYILRAKKTPFASKNKEVSNINNVETPI